MKPRPRVLTDSFFKPAFLATLFHADLLFVKDNEKTPFLKNGLNNP